MTDEEMFSAQCAGLGITNEPQLNLNDNETPAQVVETLRDRAERFRALSKRLRNYGARIGPDEPTRPDSEGA